MGIVKQLKRDLISSLAEPERIALVNLLSKVSRPLKPVNTSSMYLQHCETPTLFGFLYKQLFGDWKFTGEAVAEVMRNIDQLRTMLRQGSTATDFLETLKDTRNGVMSSPLMPRSLRISNRKLQDVWVSMHAWERFYERFCPRNASTERVVQSIQESFSRAKPVKLKQGFETIRFINNHFEQAQYFLDKSRHCRFVVVAEDNKFFLKTVEVPRER